MSVDLIGMIVVAVIALFMISAFVAVTIKSSIRHLLDDSGSWRVVKRVNSYQPQVLIKVGFVKWYTTITYKDTIDCISCQTQKGAEEKCQDFIDKYLKTDQVISSGNRKS